MSEEEKKAIEYCKKFIELTNKWAGKEKTEMSISFETILNLIEKQQKEIENSYKVKFKVGEKAKLANGMSIGCMGRNHNKEVTIRAIRIREGYIEYYVDYEKDREIHNFDCPLYERDLVKLEE